MHSTVAFVVLISVVAVLRIVEIDGQRHCHDLPAMENLQSAWMEDEWYIVQVSKNENEAEEDSCVREVNRVDICGNFICYFESMQHGEAEPAGSSFRGYPIDGVRSRLSFLSDDDKEFRAVTTILDTDYKKYAIWVTCTVENDTASNHVEITSLYPELDAETLDYVKQVLRNANVSDDLSAVNQKDCIDTQFRLFPPNQAPLRR